MGGRDDNPWPLLEKINCPVLVVEAEESENKKFVDIKRAVSLLSQGRHQAVAAAGHLLPMQKPKELAEIIKEFSRQCA
jgi:pimeloyl-ACP methyl ester carboxylesterase